MKEKKKWKMSYVVKERLQIAGFITLMAGIVAAAPIALYLTESDYKYQEGDVVELLVGDRVGTIADVNYTSDGDVPKYDIRILDMAGKPSELEYYETEIKGLVKKIN